MDLQSLNSVAASHAYTEFIKCCGSAEWARRMVGDRPFRTQEELLARANEIWWSLHSADWLEAFRSHPKIGEKKAEREVSSDAQRWSEQEQAASGNARPETQRALASLNQAYEEKFGFIYIVCASGKTSEEMLEILRRRMDNAPENELPIAAAEQSKITELRLKKLLDE